MKVMGTKNGKKQTIKNTVMCSVFLIVLLASPGIARGVGDNYVPPSIREAALPELARKYDIGAALRRIREIDEEIAGIFATQNICKNQNLNAECALPPNYQTLLNEKRELVQQIHEFGAPDREEARRNAGERDDWSYNCGSWWDFDLVCHLANILERISRLIAGGLGYVGDFVFQASLDVSVANFNTYAGGNSSAVNEAWKITRNVANIGLIFMLLYAAVSLVLQLGTDVKKMVIRIIIVGLLINFSAMFARIIIDASNIVAHTIYEGINEGNLGGAIKGAMQSPIPIAASVGDQFYAYGRAIQDSLLTILFGLISLFVLLAGSILLLIRALRLMILIILAPLAFLFYVNPKTEGLNTAWWKTLINDSFFAPAFVLMIFVSLTISDALYKVNIGGEVSSFTEQFIRFILIAGFMIASLIIAKKMGAAGADFAMKWAGRGTGALVETGMFAARLTGRAIGKGAGAVDQRITGGKIGSGAGWIGKRTGALLKRVENAAPGVVADVRKGITEAVKSPLKTASEGIAGLTKPFGTTTGILGETKDEERERRKREKEEKDAEKDKKLADAKKDARAQANNLKTATDDEREAIKTKVQNYSKDEVIKIDQDSLEALAEMFNDNQIDILEKELSADKFAKIEKARYSKLEGAVKANNSAEVAETMKLFTGKTIANIPEEILKNENVIKNLTREDLEKIFRKGGITRDAEKVIERVVVNPANNHPAADYFRGSPGTRGGSGRRGGGGGGRPTAPTQPTPAAPPASAPPNNSNPPSAPPAWPTT